MTEPTDAELIAVANAAGLSEFTSLTDRHELGNQLLMFARAVLAKFGTPPAVAGEPVAWEATVPGYIKYVTQSRYERFSAIAKSGYKPYKCSNCATPQPTQAQAGAVPLTDEQMAKLYRQSAMRDHIMVRGDWEQGVRDAEAAHGIKGSQHG